MLVLLRSLMLLACAASGAFLAAVLKLDPAGQHFAAVPTAVAMAGGALVGILFALVAVGIELMVRRISLSDVVIVVTGLVIGAIAAWCVTYAQEHLPLYLQNHIAAHKTYYTVGTLAVYALFAYLGIGVAVRCRTAFSLVLPRFKYGRNGGIRPMVVDTSAIIDGRVVELYKIGFLRSKIVVAEFVLHELQMVSDSQVPLTRAKGRRGLDTLKRLQEVPGTDIEVVGIDYADVKEVDDKLMKLAKEIDGTILTTDFNLEQVAKIQRISVLNIFALVNAVKAPFIPGERLTLQIAKEGSEPNQGVGFLEDGTMIVVSNARQYIGQRAEVEIVSMIQGASGRMFFGEIMANGQQGGTSSADRGGYDRSRGQDRRRA